LPIALQGDGTNGPIPVCRWLQVPAATNGQDLESTAAGGPEHGRFAGPVHIVLWRLPGRIVTAA
jgi:hypothetical protein